MASRLTVRRIDRMAAPHCCPVRWTDPFVNRVSFGLRDYVGGGSVRSGGRRLVFEYGQRAVVPKVSRLHRVQVSFSIGRSRLLLFWLLFEGFF